MKLLLLLFIKRSPFRILDLPRLAWNQFKPIVADMKHASTRYRHVSREWLNIFTDRSKAMLLLWFIYAISFLFLLCFHTRLLVTSWERADRLALVCDVLLWSCHCLIGILCQTWCLIVSIPDLCPLSYFLTDLYDILYTFILRSSIGPSLLDTESEI